jgi:hypothetical protein
MGVNKSRVDSEGSDAIELVGDVGLGSRDQVFMERVMRFLIAVQTPQRALRAQREGYTREEHALGWRLWRVAAGEGRALDEFFAELRSGADETSPEQARVLRELDAFENTWFPRVRAIIRRVIPAASRDEFEVAFFKDLSQQPLGPAVVGSVSALLARIEGLAHSEQAGAGALASTLATRGLNAAKIAQVRGLISSLETRVPAGIKVNGAVIRQAQEAQLAALAQLRDWFNDWAVTLRSVFQVNEQIRMGLTTIRRDAAGDVGDDTDDTGDTAGAMPPPASGGGALAQ